MSDNAKYPRTPHLPWSPGASGNDDRVDDVARWLGVPIIVTEKLDGENRAWTRDSVFARSHAKEAKHPSASWSKAKWAERRHVIPAGLTIFLEDCYAVHSIWYEDMAWNREYLFVIGVRDDAEMHWFSMSDVERLGMVMGLPIPPILFRGVLNRVEELKAVTGGLGKNGTRYGGKDVRTDGKGMGVVLGRSVREGEIVRVEASFPNDAFQVSVAKSVRCGHVQTNRHWRTHWRPQHKVIWSEVSE